MKERSSYTSFMEPRIGTNGEELTIWRCLLKWKTSKLRCTATECLVKFTKLKEKMSKLKAQSVCYGATSTDGEHERITTIC
eukprot:9572443-Heterocapsa_arctica.AAC.1